MTRDEENAFWRGRNLSHLSSEEAWAQFQREIDERDKYRPPEDDENKWRARTI